MRLLDRQIGTSVFLLLVVLAVTTAGYALTTRQSFDLPDIAAVVYPLGITVILAWYLRRYYHDPAADTVLPMAAAGSLLGFLVMTGATQGLILGQETQGGVLVNEVLLTVEMGLNGLLVGLLSGHFYGRSVDARRRLRRRNHELAAQVDRLDAFASIVSHDLRNPLNVAQGRVTLARDETDDGTVREHLDTVIRAHERMSDLIEDLLRFAREGQLIEEVESVDLPAVIQRAWTHVSTTEKTLVVETDRTIRADRARLEELFENLVRNAVEHGGDDVTVTVGDCAGGFYVADDGPGIPVDERAAVFEAGYSTADGGTGFGLKIVEQIVDAHRWDVRVTESETGGARFEITGVTFD